MSLDDIKDSGMNDYYVGQGKYNNPYSNGSKEFDAYERGWMQSLKRDGGKLVESAKEPTKIKKTEKNVQNLYALAKGKNASQ